MGGPDTEIGKRTRRARPLFYFDWSPAEPDLAGDAG
jgi:hypothetical protein